MRMLALGGKMGVLVHQSGPTAQEHGGGCTKETKWDVHQMSNGSRIRLTFGFGVGELRCKRLCLLVRLDDVGLPPVPGLKSLHTRLAACANPAPCQQAAPTPGMYFCNSHWCNPSQLALARQRWHKLARLPLQHLQFCSIFTRQLCHHALPPAPALRTATSGHTLDMMPRSSPPSFPSKTVLLQDLSPRSLPPGPLLKLPSAQEHP